MIKNLKFFILITFLSISANLFAQIIVKPLPINKDILVDSVFFDESPTRHVQLLHDNWKIYYEGAPSNYTKTTVPASFDANETMIYETSFSLTKDEVENKSIMLGFLGVNYSSEVLLNNLSIYKRASGEIPFEIELPKDILKADAQNKLSIKVNPKLTSDNTIPVLQRFLFPSNQRGITRDVFLKFTPNINISSASIKTLTDKNLSSAKVDISISLDNLRSLGSSEALNVKFRLRPNNKQGSEFKHDLNIDQIDNDVINKQIEFEVSNPFLWSPESPIVYLCEIGLYSGSQLIDKTTKEITFQKFTVSNESLTLNGKPFNFNGTTYFINETELAKTNVYDKIYKDLQLIKSTGFNSVRFPKSYPNPYALKICQELGLISLVELPLNSIPEEMLNETEFQTRAIHRLQEIQQQYRTFSNSFLIGLGSGYLPNSPITEAFLSKLAGTIVGGNIINYASFNGIQKDEIENLDIYGIELFTRSSDDTRTILSDLDNNSRYFLSEVSYPNYVGSSSGYLIPNSIEAQAKFFDNTINISTQKKLGGFFLNTMFDYKGDVKSFFTGYSKNNNYSLGILKDNSSLNSLTYKVLHSKLNHESKVTIPIGTTKDENKLMFILLALALSLIMAVLINTKKKFREDCTRALFRPYNFFADIRDHRIISSAHTFILLLVETGSTSLLFTILLFYLRTNILLEKILLSFGSSNMIDTLSELAWHPEKCFVYIFVLMVILIAFLSVIIKLASFSIKTRVEFTSIFYSVVWAFLPFTLLLPVELILYKILSAYGLNPITIIFLFIFILWILQRILKGIHVIFDVRALPVYLYSILLILVISGIAIIYFQFANSTIYYIFNAISQYKSMPF